MAARARNKGRTVEAEQRAGGARRPWTMPLAVAVLTLIHFALAVTSAANKSNTYDELAHLMRGYSYRMTGDFRLGPPHPPLAHYWAALPGHNANLKFPTLDQTAWRTSDMWTIGRQFYYYKNMGNAPVIDDLLHKGRAMIAVWSAALGCIVFLWARRLFGDAGALLSLTLYAFSPTMLAHGRLVTTDCGVALFFLAGLGSIWWMLHRISPGSVLASSAALACLFLTKMSAVLIIPVGLILLVFRLAKGSPLPVTCLSKTWSVRRRIPQLACYLSVMSFWIVCVWTALWMAYGFRYDAMPGGDGESERFYTSGRLPDGRDIWDHELRGLDHLRPTIEFLRTHRVFPEAYIYCAASSSQTARGRNAFLNGHVSIHGFPSFFPYTLLVKTPLPLFGILAAAAFAPWYRNRSAPPENRRPTSWPTRLYPTAPLWVFLIAYWAVSLSSQLNIGHRHILPTYPVLFILCGAAGCYLKAAARPVRYLMPTLTATFIAAALLCFPNYLAYFNLIAGGPAGAYRHLVDSSLDWGQDLPGLRDYLAERRRQGLDTAVYVSYFGSGGSLALKHFGIQARTLPSRLADHARGDYRLAPGLYAISATNLQQVYNGLRTKHGGDAHRWNAEFEESYRKLLPTYEAFAATEDSAGARKPYATRQFERTFRQFARLRFARLCAYLRTREPDDHVNHSILIYNLTAADLQEALHENSPKTEETPATQ